MTNNEAMTKIMSGDVDSVELFKTNKFSAAEVMSIFSDSKLFDEKKKYPGTKKETRYYVVQVILKTQPFSSKYYEAFTKRNYQKDISYWRNAGILFSQYARKYGETV